MLPQDTSSNSTKPAKKKRFNMEGYQNWNRWRDAQERREREAIKGNKMPKVTYDN